MQDRRSRPDPRSPVQPPRSSAALPVAAALIGAVAFWSWQQDWTEEVDEPVAETSTAPVRPPVTTPVADLPKLFRTEDYPVQAIRNDEQGTVVFALTIDARGRVTRCVIQRSSGSATLDRQTCRILTRRVRARPALDGDGRPTRSELAGRIRWVLPEQEDG